LGLRFHVIAPAQRRVTSFVAGLHDSYAVAESSGWQHGVQIDLTPIGAHMLLGVAMDSLANRVIELEQILGRFAARLAEQLYETASWQARFDVLDAAIASRVAGAREPSPAISWALGRLTETGGRLSIGALADEVGSSRQYLATRSGLHRPQATVLLVGVDRDACLPRAAGAPVTSGISLICDEARRQLR
jgi:hypothetical protein